MSFVRDYDSVSNLSARSANFGTPIRGGSRNNNLLNHIRASADFHAAAPLPVIY